jgi:hypothetical protein
VDGQGDGRNSTLLNPRGRRASSLKQPLSVPGQAKTPGRKGLGDWATRAKGERAILGGAIRKKSNLLSVPARRLGEGAPGHARLTGLGEWGRQKRGEPMGGTIPGETIRTKCRGQGPRGRRLRAGEMGEGDPTLLDPAFGSPSRARKGPPSVQQEGDTSAAADRVYCTLGEIGCEPGDVARLQVMLSIGRL